MRKKKKKHTKEGREEESGREDEPFSCGDVGSATEDVLEHAKLLGRGLLALAGLEGIRTKVRVVDESLGRSCILLLGRWRCQLLLLLLGHHLLGLKLLLIGAIVGVVSEKEGVGVVAVDIIRGRGGPTHCARCHSPPSVCCGCVCVLAFFALWS